MLNAIKFNASRLHRTSVLGVLFFAVVMVLLPISAHAQCPRRWDATGEWQIRQGPEGRTVVRLSLEQSGMAIRGIASRDVRAVVAKGNVIGDADGDDFTIAIDWLDGGEFSIYRAKVSASGKLEGETFVGPNKRNRETWYGEITLPCPTGPINSWGKIKPLPKPSVNPTVKTGAPIMSASQATFPPYQPVGFVILTWDAGPEHPNAEVWVRYGNSRERLFVVKQPTGGQQVAVQRGQMYRFVLMDGRDVLASATFVAQ